VVLSLSFLSTSPEVFAPHFLNQLKEIPKSNPSPATKYLI
jgi:hypothetical protein